MLRKGRCKVRIPLRMSIAALAVVAMSVGVVSFVVVRSIDDNDPTAEAEQPNPYEVEHPGPDVTPVPGSTPDVTKPWWYVPYLNEDARKPIYDQTINGITIGPNAKPSGGPCTDTSVVEVVPIDDAKGTEVGISPKYLPLRASRGEASATLCDGLASSADAAYTIPPDPKSQHLGGYFHIGRASRDPSAAIVIPAERWSAQTIAGYPAAIARPILPMGLGQSAIVVYDGAVVTVVLADGLTLGELTAIAEGLFR